MIHDCKCSGIELFGVSKPCKGCILNDLTAAVEKFHSMLDAGWIVSERGSNAEIPPKELRMNADGTGLLSVYNGEVINVWPWESLVWIRPQNEDEI